ncbi:MAG: DMT family transporter [Bacillota bacterium]
MGYVEVAAASILWALSGPFIRKLENEGLTSWDVVLGRAMFSAILLSIWVVSRNVYRKRRLSRHPDESTPEPILPGRENVGTFLALGFLAVVLAQSTYFYALSQTSVAVAVTLNYTAPFFVMVISYFAYKQPITRDKGISLLGALCGVALVSGFIGIGAKPVTGSFFGVFMGLLSGLAYGSQTLVYKRVGRRYGPIYLNLWMMAFGFLELSVLTTAVTGSIPAVFRKLAAGSPRVWSLLALMGIGPGLMAFVLFADGINKVDASRGSIVAMCEPVAACLLGYFLLGETLTGSQVLGVALVIGSILGVSLPESKERLPRQRSLDKTPRA